MALRASNRAVRRRGTPLLLLVFLFPPLGLSAQRVIELPGTDRTLQPRLEEVFRVGKIDGADWEIFGERPEIAFDGAGNLHVFDPTSHRVVVIDRDGRFVRQIGRRGDGPGELRNPMGFTVERDGTVVIADMGHAAFLVYGPDGSFRHSVSFRGGDGFTVLGEIQADPRGGALLSAGQRAAMIQAGGGAAMGARRPAGRSITRFDLGSGGGSQSLFTGWAPPPPPPPQAVGGAMMRPMPRAFEPEMFTATLPDGGLVVSDSTGYDLKILSPEGRVERILRRPFHPVAVTSQIQRAERERRLAEIESGGGGAPGQAVTMQGGAGAGNAPSPAQLQAIRRRQLEQLQFYPEISVVTGLRTGWSGKIWVSRVSPGGDPAAGGPVDVLTPTGDYLGSIPAGGAGIPDAFGPEGLVGWIERDRFDTPVVAVRRLPEELR